MIIHNIETYECEGCHREFENFPIEKHYSKFGIKVDNEHECIMLNKRLNNCIAIYCPVCRNVISKTVLDRLNITELTCGRCNMRLYLNESEEKDKTFISIPFTDYIETASMLNDVIEYEISNANWTFDKKTKMYHIKCYPFTLCGKHINSVKPNANPTRCEECLDLLTDEVVNKTLNSFKKT